MITFRIEGASISCTLCNDQPTFVTDPMISNQPDQYLVHPSLVDSAGPRDEDLSSTLPRHLPPNTPQCQHSSTPPHKPQHGSGSPKDSRTVYTSILSISRMI